MNASGAELEKINAALEAEKDRDSLLYDDDDE